jgi:hypothetical protein
MIKSILILFKPKRSPLEKKARERFMNYKYQYVEIKNAEDKKQSS